MEARLGRRKEVNKTGVSAYIMVYLSNLISQLKGLGRDIGQEAILRLWQSMNSSTGENISLPCLQRS